MTTNLTEPATETSSESAEQHRYPYVEHEVDPRKLRAEDNVRVVGNIRETRPNLVASVAEHGVNPMVSVINVAPGRDGVLEVLVGFHRTAAAVAVKQLENPGLTIPVLVHAPGTTRRDVIVAQGIENIHREGFTQAEEAVLYEQLALEGLDDREIAQQLTRRIERVSAGRAVATSAPTHATSQAMPAVDLMTLALLTEFADNEDDHQELVDVLTNRPHNFEFKLGRIRERRTMRAAKATEQQRLAAQGYSIVENQHTPPLGAARLEELCAGQDENPLDPGDHATCAGRAIAIDVDSDLEVERIEFCVDYAEHGHRTILSVKEAAAVAQLYADGVALVDRDADEPVMLRDLFTDEQAQQTITAAEHAGCAGHAAYIEADPYDSSVEVIYVCADPTTHGHVLRGIGTAKAEPSAAFKAAELDRARKNNGAWREAKAERRAWLADFFTGWRTWTPPSAAKRKGKPTAQKQMLPPRVHHWLALAPVLAAEFLKEAAPAHTYACTLLKLDQPAGTARDANPIVVHLRKKTTSDTQAILLRLAQVIGACEAHWDFAYTDKNADSSWRSPSTDTRFYFELLDTLGYPLAHVEQLINNPELDIEKWPHLAPEPEAAEPEPAPDAEPAEPAVVVEEADVSDDPDDTAAV